MGYAHPSARSILGLSLFITFGIFSIGSVSAADKAGMADYLAGLDALQNLQWDKAAQSFTAAVGADDEEPNYHLGLGIAHLGSQNAQAAIPELTRAVRLGKNDLTTKRWAAGAYRFAGDELTASKIDDSSDWPGVQEVCQNYGTALRERQGGKVLTDKKNAFEAQVVAFAKNAKGDRPESVQALGNRINQELTAGKFNDALKDLQPLLAKDPWNEDLLLQQAHALVGKHRNQMARIELSHILSVRSNVGFAYALRSIAEATIGNQARSKSDWVAAQQYDPSLSKSWQPVIDAVMSKAGPDLAGQSPQEAWNKLRDAALADQPFDQLYPLALDVAKIQNAHRRRWDEEYQDDRRRLEDAVRANPKDTSALLSLGVFLYREANIPGEQLGPGGQYRAFRAGGAVQRNRDLNYALAMFDRVLAIDPKNAMAITWKAAIQLEYGDWNVGEQLVQQALQIREDIPELLELLSRVQASAAQTKNYQATNLRTPKTWTQFGINYDVIWTRYPSQGELNRADSLDTAAQQLWNNSAANLKAAVAKRAGTADGFYFSALLKQHDGDAGAIDDFKKAAEMEPKNRRNREAYIRALKGAGQDELAAAEQEKFTLEHETTATVRLANAWENIDRTAYRSALENLQQAVAIDPADSRIAAYQATILTAQNKLEDAIKWYNMALAQEEANLNLDAKTIQPDGKNEGTLTINDAGFALLLNLRRAARFEQLKKAPEQLAAYEWNCSIGRRVDTGATHSTAKAERACLPNTFRLKAWTPKTIWNMVAWSEVLAAHCDMLAGKTKEALAHDTIVADASETPDIFDPQALAIAGKNRLLWGPKATDAAVRQQWANKSMTLSRLNDNEIQQIGSIVTASSSKDGSERTFEQQQVTMPLYKFRWMPVIQGGYDYRNNPNYKGSNDSGPDDLPRKGLD